MLTLRSSQIQAMSVSRPNAKMVQPCPEDAAWIEFRLVDQDGSAVPGAKYKVVLPDGSTMQGGLDEDGKVRFENIVAGQSRITFPEIDGTEWYPLGEGGSAATSDAGAASSGG